jgi:hypothetical protein
MNSQQLLLTTKKIGYNYSVGYKNTESLTHMSLIYLLTLVNKLAFTSDFTKLLR